MFKQHLLTANQLENFNVFPDIWLDFILDITVCSWRNNYISFLNVPKQKCARWKRRRKAYYVTQLHGHPSKRFVSIAVSFSKPNVSKLIKLLRGSDLVFSTGSCSLMIIRMWGNQFDYCEQRATGALHEIKKSQQTYAPILVGFKEVHTPLRGSLSESSFIAFRDCADLQDCYFETKQS